MHEPIDGRRRASRRWRPFLHSLTLGGMIAAIFGLSADAGAIRGGALSARAIVRIQKADPNSDFWVQALKHHALKLRGPRTPTVITLNADGSVPESAYIRYLQWREGLNVKQFDAIHPELMRLLRRVKPPSAQPPPGSDVPIEPPGFTPSPMEVTPPNVPEPSSILLGLALIGAGAIAGRRRAARSLLG